MQSKVLSSNILRQVQVEYNILQSKGGDFVRKKDMEQSSGLFV